MSCSRPKAWPSSPRVVAAVALVTAVVLSTTGPTAGAVPSRQQVGVAPMAKKGLAYYNNNPCALITRSEVVKVVHAPMGLAQPSPNSYGGSCSYQTTDPASGINLVYGFDAGAAGTMSHIKGASHPERAIGHGAYCISTRYQQAQLLANVGIYQGGPYTFQVNVDSCAHAVALAEVAFAHLS